MAKRQRDPAKEQYWRQVLGQWQRSGATIRGFCARHRLAEANFHAWRRELARRDREGQITNPARSAGFVPVRVVDDQHVAAQPAAIEIVLPRGLVVRVPAGADGAAVRTVLTALGAAPDDSHGDHDAGAGQAAPRHTSGGSRIGAAAGEARSC